MESHPLNEASDLSSAVRPPVQFTHAAVSVSVRPLCDSRYGKLRAGKLPFIGDGDRFALRLAEVGLRQLGEGRRTVTEHACRVSTTPAHLPFRKFSKLGYLRFHSYT